MNKNKILKHNKLIAEFMGYKLVDCHSPFLGKKWRKEDLNNSPLYNLLECNKEEQLRFNSSWEWLMSVIEEIEKLGLDTVIDFRYNPHSKRKDKMFHWCQIGKDTIAEEIYGSSIKTKIEATYIAVVKFVTLYNKKNEKRKRK